MKYFLIIFLLVSCASKELSKPKSLFLPEWVNSPMSSCDEKKEICASGEGDGAALADANARKSLAQFFSTKIESKMNVFSHTQQNISGPLDGGGKEYVANEINEVTEELLEGVSIKARFQDQVKYYALAIMDREAALERFRSRIKEIDTKLVAYNNEGKKSYYGRMKKLYLLREGYNERYHFLAGVKIPSKVSFEEILKKKKLKLKSAINLMLYKSNEPFLKEFVANMMSEHGFKLTENENLDYDAVLVLDFKSKKEFLNVDGFEKHLIMASLTTQTKSKENLGTIQFQAAAVGRNLDQAISKVRPDIEKNFEEKFEDLNID